MHFKKKKLQMKVYFLFLLSFLFLKEASSAQQFQQFRNANMEKSEMIYSQKENYLMKLRQIVYLFFEPFSSISFTFQFTWHILEFFLNILKNENKIQTI